MNIQVLVERLRELNRNRLARRRAKKEGYELDTEKQARHLIAIGDGRVVDVVKDYGQRADLDPASITLNTSSDAPEISIVIAAYGKLQYTLRCLASIARHPPSAPYEVIVVEDASRDEDALRCGDVRGLRFIVNERNLGYLRTTNRGVVESSGRFVYLLNNDTQVLPGAIDALYETCRRREGAMAGSRLIYPDGTLQDAGGIVWRDGEAWIYGRGGHPARLRYNYLRPADYCCGASLMLSRQMWDRVGGYDERYAPAYYEDTDLAYAVRAAGGAVFYQPRSVVIHDEGASHGTSTQSGPKAAQVVNAKKFAQKWAEVIARESMPRGRILLKAKDRARHRKTILVIDHYIPEPDQDAGSRSIMSFMEAMMDLGHSVKFWPDNFRATPGYTEQLQAKGIEVMASPDVFSFTSWLAGHSAEVDGFLLSRPTVAKNYIKAIRKLSRAPVVFYGHDLHFARMEMQARVTNNSNLFAEAEAMKRLEQSIWKQCDVSFYPSQEEVDAVSGMDSTADVRRANAYCLEVKPPKAAKDRGLNLLFVAGFRHPPNEDAAVWLVNDILPLVRQVYPEVKLVLAGSSPTEKVLALHGDGVTVTGSLSIEALAAEYERACVSVVPLRFGAGVKLKVLEAMVERVPLVTTSVGVQGLGNAGFLPVADDASGFASHVVGLLSDASRREDLVSRQAEFIVAQYSKVALCETLSKVL